MGSVGLLGCCLLKAAPKSKKVQAEEGRAMVDDRCVCRWGRQVKGKSWPLITVHLSKRGF